MLLCVFLCSLVAVPLHGRRLKFEGLLQKQQQKLHVKTNTTSKGLCSPWEVCKCMADWNEDATECQSSSCTFGPDHPSRCCPQGGRRRTCFRPKCKEIEDWSDCEWANWNGQGGAAWDEPGTNLFTDVPQTVLDHGQEGLIVMTDVDDTMKCSGGPAAGGVDETCLGTEPHEMYPGVAEFSLALARGSQDGLRPRKVVPLSARPAELKKFLAMKPGSPEDNTYRQAAEAVGIEAWGLDTENALYGGLRDSTDFKHVEGTKPTRFIKLGHRKYTNWKEVGAAWGSPTAFIGDNGQGDAVAAQMMLKRSAGLPSEQGALRVAFIHDVIRACTSAGCRSAFAQRGVFLFDHYAQAAGLAAANGFISASSCLAVCAAAPMLPCSCP